ncbi:MAG: type II secretion system protein [bacterium]
MSKLNKQLKFSKGFTLIEILLVLSIIVILVVMIIPSFSKVGGSEALDTTTMSAIAVLNVAKSSAVSSKDASDYGIRIFNNKLVSFKGSYGIENKEITISNLVTISTSTGIGTDIIFNNVSGSTSASGTITITVLNDPSKNSTIRIYSTGAVEKN